LTTKTASNSQMPEPDTSPDASPPAKKMQHVDEAKNGLNSANILISICVGFIAIAAAFAGIVVNFSQTQQLTLSTAAKVEKAEAVASDVAIIKVKQAYMEQSAMEYRQENTKKLDSIVAKLDRMADRK
jgi:flagellar biosynthesis/type III secretory pathway M-ring protein FliF/YscJ